MSTRTMTFLILVITTSTICTTYVKDPTNELTDALY